MEKNADRILFKDQQPSPLNDEQHLLVKNMYYYTIGDLERVGDHCENLAELPRNGLRM